MVPIYSLNKARFGTHRLIAQELGSGHNILDVGCNKGYLKTLANDNYFYGIDINSKDLTHAKKLGYKKVYKLDLNNYKSFIATNKFDIIVFADILEHLLYPDKVLPYFVNNYLKRTGKIIISLPNVANFYIRFNLLIGNFDYTDCGILDRTHLHLYTIKSAKELIERCNLKIIKVKYSSNFFGKIIKTLPFLGPLFGYNLIFICQQKS
ncbi:hypothetical protein A3D03_05185 [Candidatus Gottesmanbacteria bacterium RIFCSPHIGHO2_02_FULL_40_13]|uniref:Methyltransferase domain-containing protein n=1 Tax=Candidatus Gottesmanbacteria bacterium RIFCSPHIGHO2_02_FULL_40_13 TaxID=1798384 RepID=A0A1F6A913_9BACT|nr:MAG: hypothetical protein A3D03_05185 [Candidatus Gottesmanbacteria bacterium RIFCSPHIGHO2_02_FULL_40_13]